MAKETTPKQTTLFGMEPTPEAIKDAVVLHEPAPEMLQDATKLFLMHYTKQQLYELGRAFRPLLKNKVLICELADGRKILCKDVMPLFSSSSYKEQLAKAVAYIFCEPRNLALYTDSLSAGMRDLWRLVLINLYVSEAEAQKILKDDAPIFSSRPHSFYYHDTSSWTKPGFALFDIARSLSADTMRYGYRQSQNFISVTPLLHNFFFALFYPESIDPELSLLELPDDGHQEFNMEAECYVKYNLLDSLLRSGRVKVAARGVSQADVKKVAKQLGLAEFMEGDAMTGSIRSRYYVELMALCQHQFYEKSKGKPAAYEEVLRKLFDNLLTIEGSLPSLLLPHIKGLRKQMTEYNDLLNLCLLMCQWMREEPERWVSVHDVLLKIIALNDSSPSSRFDTLVFRPVNQKSEVIITNEFSGKNIAADSFVMEFGFTALQAFSFLLCSLGMAELSLSPLNRRESPFARAEYLRLTPLGRYALGIDDEYEAPQQEQTAYFELDPERLIIRSLVEPNPYAQLLLDTSVAISRNRFETSAQSFLAHCVSRSDVEEKIGIFRQFVSNELPPLWKQFFDSLLQHCNPLTTDRTGYVIYRLSPQNADLIRLLTTDPTLRRLFIRAEGYLILVKKEDQQKFTDELKKHGYLL